MLKKIPLDLYELKDFIGGDFLYIDKTEYLARLLGMGKLFFLSRPRRFGKSLMISTLNELFRGNKELFKDTWIGQEGRYDFPVHPVIRLDFSALNWKTPELLEVSLLNYLVAISQAYGVDIVTSDSISALQSLIYKLSERGHVVLLVDEYDSPIIHHLTDLNIAEEMRVFLSNFYTTIKGALGLFHFVMITGVSKFAKTSIFSAFNNVIDLTMNPIVDAVCGLTQEELEGHYMPYIESLAEQDGMTVEQTLAKMKQWYNGYRFSMESQVKVYNPFSVHHCLAAKKFRNYWFASGTPTLLVKLLQKYYPSVTALNHAWVPFKAFDAFSLTGLPFMTLLYQTGYLTLEDIDEKEKKYQLMYPNDEVSEAFTEYLLDNVIDPMTTLDSRYRDELVSALQRDDVDGFCMVVNGILARVPYMLHMDKEGYYHTVIYIMLLVAGFHCESEQVISTGRVDMVLDTPGHKYLFEFKFNQTAEAALAQIKERSYYQRYQAEGKALVLIGMNIDGQTRKVSFVRERHSAH